MPNEVSKEKHLVQLWLDEDKWLEIRLAADSVQEPITGWIRRAVFAALRKWEVPKVNQTVYDKCSMCGKRHNREEHFKGE